MFRVSQKTRFSSSSRSLEVVDDDLVVTIIKSGTTTTKVYVEQTETHDREAWSVCRSAEPHRVDPVDEVEMVSTGACATPLELRV